MNNIEITKKLGEYTGFGIGKCKFLLKTLNEILVDALRKGQEISLLSLGKIKIAKTKKTKYFNPTNHVFCELKSKNKIVFKSSKSLKNSINF